MFSGHGILFLFISGVTTWKSAQSRSPDWTDRAGQSSVSGFPSSSYSSSASREQRQIPSTLVTTPSSPPPSNLTALPDIYSDWDRANCEEWVRHASTMSTLALAEWANLDPSSVDWIRPFTASDSSCASQWSTWIRNVGLATSVSGSLAQCRMYKSTMTHVETIRRFVPKETECDGIPRGSYETLGYVTSTRIGNFVHLNEYDRQWAIAQQYDPPDSWHHQEWVQTHPPPSCSLVGQDGVQAWKNIRHIFHLMVPKQWGGIRMFGHPPTPNKCNFTGPACYADVEEVKLIYFEPDIETADVCGNDGHGSYRVRLSEEGGVRPTQVISAITFERNLGRYVAQDSATISGPFTFTSGHYYIAYIGARASDLCSLVGPQTYLSGVVEVPLTSLYTGIVRPQSWAGSDMDLARFLAAGQTDWKAFRPPSLKDPPEKSDVRGWTDSVHNMTWLESSRLLNVADLRGPVPAANYYMQASQSFYNCKTCSTIIEGKYNYAFVLPDILRYLDPAWATCITDDRFIRDPPLVLTATKRLSPSKPAWASDVAISEQSLIRFTTLARPGQSISPVTPSPTPTSAPTLATATRRRPRPLFLEKTPTSRQDLKAQETEAKTGIANSLSHIDLNPHFQFDPLSLVAAVNREQQQQHMEHNEGYNIAGQNVWDEPQLQDAVAANSATRDSASSVQERVPTNPAVRIHAKPGSDAAAAAAAAVAPELDSSGADYLEQQNARPDVVMEANVEHDQTKPTSTLSGPFASSLKSGSVSNVPSIRKSGASRKPNLQWLPWAIVMRGWAPIMRRLG